MRERVDTRTPLGDVFGYSRAIKVGNLITVAGTTTAKNDAGEIVGLDAAYVQTATAIRRIEHALKELGASLKDVVRTRIYTTDMTRSEEIGRAHREFFGESKPASTLVQVVSLIEPGLMVEVEADAIIES